MYVVWMDGKARAAAGDIFSIDVDGKAQPVDGKV
jgi:hypothetical protein